MMFKCQGFEQGPIRPPSEAASLLLRVTRNCPWGQCTFCNTFKNKKFSMRPVADVIADIDAIHRFVTEILHGERTPDDILRSVSLEEQSAFHAAWNWISDGMESIFLQDGDSLVIQPKKIITILQHIKSRFPNVERITTYARSASVARISSEHMVEIAAAGLNRIHIGMETASDTILSMVKKGATKKIHIAAGLNVKQAGIELSTYILTGIGGSEFSREHAIETADAINQINPDFIRFRTLHLLDDINLFANSVDCRYLWATDLVIAEEIMMLLDRLNGVTTTIKSDHFYNLFQEIDGVLPNDKERLLGVLQRFIAMAPADRALFQVGKRAGLFVQLSDMLIPERLAQAADMIRRSKITPDNVDQKIHEMLQERLKAGIRS